MRFKWSKWGSETVPEPSASVDPRLTTWRQGRRLYRVHPLAYGPNEFNPGTSRRARPGRFHPIKDRKGKPIPTLYAADQIQGALSETVFYNLVVGGGYVNRGRLLDLVLSRIQPQRDLVFVDLTRHGLRRLSLRRNQLLEVESADYRWTVRWAEALHRGSDADGMVWVSRQFDTSKAVVLFGDRVRQEDLRVDGESESLYSGKGFQMVQKAATDADIMLVEG